MHKDYEFLIIGSGFGGQVAAIILKERGEHDFLILERRCFMGGTWSQNTYPGAAVDVHSPLYSIASEPYDWSQIFADQYELQAYADHIIEKHSLKEKTRVNTNVEKIEWHEESQLWAIHVGENESLTARIVINATGPLSTPVIPDFKGKNNFKGVSFHTNNWDQSYDYRDKRVAVIGSGASAAQLIPEIAPHVEHLHVFQRTPHWVVARPDHFFGHGNANC